MVQRVPSVYLAALSDDGMLHLIREGAESSLCGLPAAGLAREGRIESTAVCRRCIDWNRRRVTGTFPPVPRR
jgi:hypothetical protein